MLRFLNEEYERSEFDETELEQGIFSKYALHLNFLEDVCGLQFAVVDEAVSGAKFR